MRTIYDIYGVEGVESEWHVALYDMDRNTVSTFLAKPFGVTVLLSRLSYKL